MEPSKILETYYDHYKETNSLSKTAQSRRNKSFVYLCILEAISFLMIRNPDFICGLLNEAAAKKLETTIQISTDILQTLIWILIAYVLVRYVQNVLYVERQYLYLDGLEKRIAKQLGKKANDSLFSREGDNYLKDYPVVLNFIDLFYKVVAPILFGVINVVHIVQEWNNVGTRLGLICDTVICITILIITWFYFFAIHKKITAWFLKCQPIKWMANLLRNWFKEV